MFIESAVRIAENGGKRTKSDRLLDSLNSPAMHGFIAPRPLE